MPPTDSGAAPTISGLGPASPEHWDAALEASPHATFFHSRSWAEIWQAASRNRLRPEPVRVRFSDGASAVVPICFDTRSGFRVSSPAGSYGGWLCEAPLGKPHADALARHLLRQYPAFSWRLNPFNELERASAPASAREEHTRVLELAPGIDSLRRGFSKGHRAAIGQARRLGVEAAPARGDEAWAAYARLYASSLSRWGARASVRHDARLFQELAQREGDRVRLWLARHGEEVVAGAIVLRSGEHAAYWHGAARGDRFHLRPVHLLLHEAIEHACHEGLEIFDFNPSGGLAGVEAFKKGFGARPLPCPVVAYERLPWWKSLRVKLGGLRAKLEGQHGARVGLPR